MRYKRNDELEKQNKQKSKRCTFVTGLSLLPLLSELSYFVNSHLNFPLQTIPL